MSRLDRLGAVVEEPLLVTSSRLAGVDVPVSRRFAGVRRHAPFDTVASATAAVS